MFLDDAPKQIAALEAATRSRNADGVARAAHALKGSAGLFSKVGAYEAARRLEQDARQGDLAGVDAGAEDLSRELVRLEAELRRLLEQ